MTIPVLERIGELSTLLDAKRAAGATIGLVPTMGALHPGHATLIARAAEECDVACVTVFVNPLQFGPHEDFEAYPRDLGADVRIAAASGAAMVFAPPVIEMYPGDQSTTVHVSGLTDVLDGLARPGHFDGVATVVAKLFAMAGRCHAYFGEKDFQQLAVVRRMATDLSLPVEIVGCPTARDHDGVALSSRNAYLNAEERAAAPVLIRALRAGADLLARGERDPARVRRAMVEIVEAEALATCDQAEVVDPRTLRTPDTLEGEVVLLVAARIGPARLIDNMRASTS